MFDIWEKTNEMQYFVRAQVKSISTFDFWVSLQVLEEFNFWDEIFHIIKVRIFLSICDKDKPFDMNVEYLLT